MANTIDVHGENLVSSSALATAVGVAAERIGQLTEQGILAPVTTKGRAKMYDLFPSIRTYIEYKAGIKGDTKKAIDLADLRFKEAKGGKAELELRELKGQMHRAEDVAVIVGDMIARFRAGVLSLSGRCAVDCAEAKTPTETAAIIKAASDELLNELADLKYDPRDYRKLVQEREKWISQMEGRQEEQKIVKAQTQRSRKRVTSSKPSAKTSARRKTSQ